MELDELYQEIILDHYRHPRHAGEVAEDVLLVEEENPTCGDRIRLTATVTDGVITDLRHDTHGCAISTASASMMSEQLVGLPIDRARELIRDFVAVLRNERPPDVDRLGDLAALAGVKNFPMRIKCATMSWHAAERALEKLTPAF